MDSRLRKAAEEGDTNALYECIEQDPNVLRSFDNYEFVDTPLHIAAAAGHADFAMAILNLKPSFGRKLNQNVYSPIHLALQNGHETTVLRLLEADKDLVRVKGKEGYTILHQAAEIGNVQLLAEFLKHCPTSIEDITIRNETALHIAAKNHKFEGLELLAGWLQRSHIYCKVSRKHLFNSKNTNGNTALHIAAFSVQPLMIKILVECGADKKATNMDGMKALEIIENQRTIKTEDKALSLKILRGDGVALRILPSCFMTFHIIKPRQIKPLHELLRSKISFRERAAVNVALLNLSAERINVFLVVLALILTATFQAGYSPPGGVWQTDPSNENSSDVDNEFYFGESIIYIGASIMDSSSFAAFFTLNMSVILVTSILTISLLELVGAGSFIMIPVEILLSSFACCFMFAVFVIDPSQDVRLLSTVLPLSFFCGFAVMEAWRRTLRSSLYNRFENLTSCFRGM